MNKQYSIDKGRVSDNWVRNNYSIDQERLTVQRDVCAGELDFDLDMKKDTFITKNEFILMVSRVVAKYDKVKLSHGGEYEFYEKRFLPETDDQVIERLKSIEIVKRKSEAFERKERKEFERLKAKFEPSSKEEEILLVFGNNYRID